MKDLLQTYFSIRRVLGNSFIESVGERELFVFVSHPYFLFWLRYEIIIARVFFKRLDRDRRELLWLLSQAIWPEDNEAQRHYGSDPPRPSASRRW